MTTPVKVRKKLIEVALPLEAINKAAAREKSIRHGHPSTLHLWWARRPLAAARAVIFAQMVDDPSASSDLFPTEKAQEKERKRLFKIIEDLVQWENTANEEVLSKAREEIWQSWRRTCAENADHPRAKDLFDRHKLPAFHDPFAGGGALPLEAQRLGLKAYASDLNPVAVLINKTMIEIPPKFAGRAPVNPESRRKFGSDSGSWKGAQGLAADVRYYGQWIRSEAEKRIGHLYPKIEINAAMAQERADLKPFVGRKLPVIAWLWARTVKSSNPAFRNVDVPLASTFMLGTKPGKEVYVEPAISDRGYRFRIKTGKPRDVVAAKTGTKLARGANFRCLMSGTPLSEEYIKAESMAGRMNARLMAIVLEADRGRLYLEPSSRDEEIAAAAKPRFKPEQSMNRETRDLVSGRGYGFFTWADLFTPRQLAALSTFSDLVVEARARVQEDALAAGYSSDNAPLRDGGVGAVAYGEAVSAYLGLAVGRVTDYCSTICTWANNPQMEIIRGTFARQAIPMTWDFAESNVFGPSTGSLEIVLGWISKAIERLSGFVPGHAFQEDAMVTSVSRSNDVISTDPPYYDNIAYADLSDYFYVWLRPAVREIWPDIFATIAVPKNEELVASSYRHGSRAKAERFFVEGMTKAMRRIAGRSNTAFPVTIYYAFKQAEAENESGTASTGWETFLAALLQAGFGITGTWPVRTERFGKLGMDTNMLASSIVLVCRPRAADALPATRREFVAALHRELPVALRHLQAGNIAPVDLAQAAIGPGMAIFTRYAKVLDAQGEPMSVHDALIEINNTLDTAQAEQEGDFDADTRWAVTWFEQNGFEKGEYGVAEVLATARNTSISGLVEAGIVDSERGKVRLLKPNELSVDWDPTTDTRLTNWEMVHHSIRALESEGELAAAKIVGRLGTKGEVARELCYRLYTLCERKKRAAEALSYNGLVQSWPEIIRLSKERATDATTPVQQEFA